MVVAGAADVAVQGQFFLGSSVVPGRQPVQALLEDRGHALVAGRADRQGPLAGLLQALPVIAPSQVEQPQAEALLDRLIDRPVLTASQCREYFEAYAADPGRFVDPSTILPTPAIPTSGSDRLSGYAWAVLGEEVPHDTIEQIARQYSGIRCNHIAQTLVADLLRQAEANEVSYLAFAESLVTEELQRRNRRRIDMNRRKAAFPVDKRLVEFDYRHESTITKRQVNQVLDLRFIDERANLVFIGRPEWAKPTWPSALARRHRARLQGSSPPPWP